MPVKTWVGRFTIVQGQPQEEGPHLRSFPRQRPDEDEDELYVLVEPESQENAEYTDQLAEVIGRLYVQDPLSMTGAVQRALRVAHQQLVEWNQRSLPEQQVAAGVGCLAVRERTAYVAQVGPVVAYQVKDGQVERIEPVDGALEPLGRAEQIQPTFSRCQLAPGDLVLLASPRLEQILDREALRAVLLRGANQALVELYRLARGEQAFGLVLLACSVEPEEQPAVLTTPTAAARPAEAEAASGEAAPAPPETTTGAEQPSSTPPEEVATPSEPPPEVIALPGATSPPSQAAPAPSAEPARPEEPISTHAIAVEEAGATSAPPPPPAEGATAWPAPLPSAEAEAPPPAEPPEALARSKVRLRDERENIRYPRTTGVTANLPRVPAQAIAVLIIIVLVGLIAWVVIPPTLEESKDERFQRLLNDARVSLQIAQEAADPEIRRNNLNSAEESLSDAAALQPDDPTIAGLREEVEALRTELDAAVELPQLTLIADLTERIPGSFSAKDLAIGGGGAFLLDREEGRVIALSLLAADAEPVELLRAGDLVGTQTIGRPEHIVWAEARGGLLVMDDQRRLILARFGEAPRRLRVRDARSWDSVDGIAYAGRNLYVLDAEGDQVWRYLPTQSGFDSEREPMLTDAELEDASELAVSSAIYILFEDGAIQRFQGDTGETISLAGIDRPLRSPASLTPLTSDRVLVADRGNRRIVAFSPEGVFRQQFKSATFTDLRALAVDEPNGLLYVLVGSALYRTALPPPPPPSLP